VRAAGEADVLAIELLGAPLALRQGLLRRPKAKAERAGTAPAEVPLLRATLIGAAQPLEAAQARDWLARCAAGREPTQPWVDAGLAALNVAIRAHRLATADPYAVEVTAADARAIRLGYASGEQAGAGDWEEAIVLPEEAPRAKRAERLAPAGLVADALAGRAVLSEAEDVALHALLDLRHGRTRAAALGLRAAEELAAAEAGVDASPPAGAEAAAAALRGPLDDAQADAAGAALERLVHALRRARSG
jgi:hypothetical protein